MKIAAISRTRKQWTELRAECQSEYVHLIEQHDDESESQTNTLAADIKAILFTLLVIELALDGSEPAIAILNGIFTEGPTGEQGVSNNKDVAQPRSSFKLH